MTWISSSSAGAKDCRRRKGQSVVFVNHKLPWWRRSAGGSTLIEAFYGIPDAQRVAERIEALKTGPETEPPRPDQED